jgi:galactokinase
MLETQPGVDSDKLRSEFARLYGTQPRLFRAPGRINLIGEHTDYNDGFVLPMAIDRDTVVAAAVRDDRLIRAHSSAQGEIVELDLDRPGSPRRGVWFDYLEGVAQALIARGKILRGADLLIESNVPVGAGLSSSAALEVSIGFALLVVSGEELDPLSLALAGRDAEHNYVGTMCGIMDQYVATFARAGHALQIDCRSLESILVPVDLSDTAFVVCDTNVKHNLASSEYNKRRAECEQGVQLLRQVLPDIAALRDVSISQFENHKDRLPELIRRRCRHVITENARTLRASEALKARDLKTVGALMAESHRSLRDDYEVSCVELDLMFEIAQSLEQVIGARMTGGGFGGCTINLVKHDGLEAFCDAILLGYQRETGITPTRYVVTAADGVSEIT